MNNMMYGIEIPNESSFWDEVKLRAMNNYGEWDKENIILAVRDTLADIATTLEYGSQVKQLEKEIVEGQA